MPKSPDSEISINRNRTVMIAEDEPDIREFVSYVLEDVGYNVIIAKDGQEALDHINTAPPETHPSLILLDMWMPRKSGLEVLQELKGRFRVVVTTASVQSNVYRNQPGVVDELPKPFDLADLLKKVDIHS